MTLISDIIRDAFRESNLIAITASPTSDEQTEGLRLLNRFVAALWGNEAGEKLHPVPIGRHNINRPSDFPGYTDQPQTDWFVPFNSRLILNLTSPQTVYLHPKPDDGVRFGLVDTSNNLATYPLTVQGNGYLIDGATSQTYSTSGQTREFFFREDTGTWTTVSPLLYTDSSPFPQAFDDLLIVGLALRLNPRNGVAIDDQSVDTFKTNLRKFKARYDNKIETPSELGLLRLKGIRRGGQLFTDDSDLFTTGTPFPRW